MLVSVTACCLARLLRRTKAESVCTASLLLSFFHLGWSFTRTEGNVDPIVSCWATRSAQTCKRYDV